METKQAQTKHTFGPWFQHRQYVSDKESFAIEDNGMRIGETPNFIIDAENEVNARLIAAAPELLEALIHAKNQISHPDQMIDEAIAKATGAA